jgi:predicted PurR-regulated permease PerM
MIDRRERTTSAVAKSFAIVAIGVAVVWALYLARDAILIIYISGLLAIGFGPLVHAIEHQRTVPIGKRLPRWLAILVVYLVIVGVLTLVGLLVIPPLMAQVQELWIRLPDWLDRGQTFLMRHGLLSHPLTLEEAVRNAPAGSQGNAMGTVAMALRTIVGSLFAFITTLILTFYLLIESNTLFAAFARLFPVADRPRVVEASRKVSTKVSAWLSGQLILAGTIGVSSAIGLYLLGVPYFYVLALVTAVGEMIPVIGPLLSAVPATLAGLAVSPQTALFVLIFFILQQQIENHLLVPKVMERQVGVSAVTVLVALLLGGSVLGILGAILAVPTAAILQVVLQQVLDERDRVAEQRMLSDRPKAVIR